MNDSARDTMVFGAAGVALVAGALSDATPVFLASIALGAVIVARMLERGGLAVAFAVGLVWSNAIVVTAEVVGAPQFVGLLPQAVLAVVFLARAVRGRTDVVVTSAFRILLLYGAAVVVSGLVAEDPTEVLEKYQTFLAEGALLWLLVINVLVDRRALERVLLALVVVAGVLGAITVFQYATENFTTDYAGMARLDADELDLYRSTPDYTPRLSGPSGEKNRYAQVLVVTLPLALALAHRTTRSARAVHLTAAGFIVGGIAVSGSRGGAMGVVVVLAILAAYRVVSLRLVVYVVAAAAAVLVLLPSYRERVVSSIDVARAVDDPSADVDGSILSRLNENLAAFDMFLDHPVLGVGPGGFPRQYETYAEPIGLNVRDGPREPHNLYLGIASELGMIGLGVFLVLVASIVIGLHRGWVASRTVDADLADVRGALVASVASYLVSGMFLHLSYERYLWVLLAVADAAGRLRPVRAPSDGAVGGVRGEELVVA